jgi:tRNA modification GTPase
VSGAGIEALKARIVEALRGEEAGGAGIVLGTQRQRDLFAEVARCAAEAADTLGSGGPAVAAERVYAALAALDGIIGRDTREAVLDRLFARFCIGK